MLAVHITLPGTSLWSLVLRPSSLVWRASRLATLQLSDAQTFERLAMYRDSCAAGSGRDMNLWYMVPP